MAKLKEAEKISRIQLEASCEIASQQAATNNAPVAHHTMMIIGDNFVYDFAHTFKT